MKTPLLAPENGAYLHQPPKHRAPGARYAAIYVRESFDRTGEALAVDRQLADLLPLAGDAGYIPVVYCENDTGSSDPNKPRPVYQRMVSDIADGKFDTVVAWEESRLFRNDLDQALFIQTAISLKLDPVKFRFGGDKDLSDYNAAFNFRINGAVNVRHVEEMKAKQREAFQQRAQLGRAWWPHRPFGYTMPDRDGRNVEIVPDEADAIRSAYHGVIKGRSLKEMAREWNAAGLRTPSRTIRKSKRGNAGKTIGGNQWDGLAVRQLLLSPRNAAIRTYQQRGKAPVEVGDGDWPAIVDKQLYRTVVEMLTSRARTPNAWVRTYLLSGLAVCGACGATMSGTQRGAARAGRPVYTCRHCNGVHRSLATVDALVVGLVVARLSGDNAGDLLLRRDVDMAALFAQLRDIDATETNQALMNARGDLSAAAFGAAQRELNARRGAIRAKMEDAERAEALRDLIDADDVAAAFAALPLDRQRAVINVLLTVTIHPGQVAHGKFNPDLVVPAWKI